jgi:phosphatidylcholine synthase
MTGKVALAWLVHLYTALGAVVAFLTIILIEQLRFQEAFWLMSLAVVIDATDGTLARAARVKETIPWFDGDRLEDIIDYANYVVVPCWLFIHANLLPPPDAIWLSSLPLLASAYGFCQKEAKTSDNFFLGFPSYWNIVAFYAYVLQLPRWVNGFAILLLSLLVFVPIKYIYPSRSPRFRALTISLGTLWSLAVLAIIYLLPDPPQSLILLSLLFPVYYALLSLWLELLRLRSRPNC